MNGQRTANSRPADYCHVKMFAPRPHTAPTLCRPADPDFGVTVAYVTANFRADFDDVRARVHNNYISARDTLPLCPECDETMKRLAAEG